MLNKLAQFAKDALPLESCALLLGEEKHWNSKVFDTVLLRNYDESEFSFSIHPNDLFFGYQQAKKSGLEVVGIFHSHPSLPLPSEKDKKFMQLNPIIWLIYSTWSNEYSAFLYSDRLMQVQICHQGLRRSTSLGNKTTSLIF
jgi:[CysO sulfur-carrier protein]-S-L-cysteine hydrolase